MKTSLSFHIRLKGGIDLLKTEKSGQCFRWIEDKGAYLIPAGGMLARVSENGDGIDVSLLSLLPKKRSSSEIEQFWKKYFDADLDYEAIRKMPNKKDKFLSRAASESEGIRIICGYLEAGCLDAEATNRFSYEVARHYFSVKRNYREALRYFNPVDEETYPDVVYYKQLCGLQLSFEEDCEKYAGCIKDFEDYNRGLGYEAVRFENTIMLANLYEGMQCLKDDYADAETECLEEGLKDLRYAVMTGLFIDENNVYEAEYCRRLCILSAAREDKQKAVKYGEEALELLADRDIRASEDIRNRLKELDR